MRDVSGIVVLDKPCGITSNAALQHVKRLYGAAKAGHTGSLDPLATGVLPICLGQATKLSGYLLDADKRYRVRAAVGSCTTTGDAEGQVTRRSDPAALTRPQLEAALPQFRGDIRQRPPMYSALKQGGQRLYVLARAGQDVERPARPVTVSGLTLLAFEPGMFELDIRCSKGTYVRTLVEDLAAAVGHCAHVAALRRLEAGPFRESDMVSAAALEAAAGQGREALDALLRPALTGLPHWARIVVDESQAADLARGRAVTRPDAAPGPVGITDRCGNLLGLGEVSSEGRLLPRRWMS